MSEPQDTDLNALHQKILEEIPDGWNLSGLFAGRTRTQTPNIVVWCDLQKVTLEGTDWERLKKRMRALTESGR